MDDTDHGMFPRRNPQAPHQFQLRIPQVALHLLHQHKKLGIQFDAFAPLFFLSGPQAPGRLAVRLELRTDLASIQAVFQIDPLFDSDVFPDLQGYRHQARAFVLGDRRAVDQDLPCQADLECRFGLRRALEFDPQPQQRAEGRRWLALMQTFELQPDFVFLAVVQIQADPGQRPQFFFAGTEGAVLAKG